MGSFVVFCFLRALDELNFFSSVAMEVGVAPNYNIIVGRKPGACVTVEVELSNE